MNLSEVQCRAYIFQGSLNIFGYVGLGLISGPVRIVASMVALFVDKILYESIIVFSPPDSDASGRLRNNLYAAICHHKDGVVRGLIEMTIVGGFLLLAYDITRLARDTFDRPNEGCQLEPFCEGIGVGIRLKIDQFKR